MVPQGLSEVVQTLLTNFVANPVQALMNGNYIGILFWACLFGLAMKVLPMKAPRCSLPTWPTRVSGVRWIINLAPFGIMGLVYTNVSGNGLAIFTQYGRLLLLLVGTMLFMALVVSPFIIFPVPALQPVSAGVPLPEGIRPDRILHPQLCGQHPRQHGPVRKAGPG